MLFLEVRDAWRPRCTLNYKSNCIANLKCIEGAKATWALEFQKSTNDIPSDTDLFGINGYIRVKPTCGEGGIYRLGMVEQKTTCSIPGHTL